VVVRNFFRRKLSFALTSLPSSTTKGLVPAIHVTLQLTLKSEDARYFET
jgi:hypothetical protein